MNSDLMSKTVLDLVATASKTQEILERLDTDTLPAIKSDIKETKHAVTRIEIKQGEDMEVFAKDKEDIYTRLKPLEEDLRKRQGSILAIRNEMFAIARKTCTYALGLVGTYLVARGFVNSGFLEFIKSIFK